VEFAELEKRSDLREILDRNDPIPRDHDPTELKLTRSVDERWIRAHRAFTTLKTKIATTPVLRHFDETRTPHPVGFASRTLKPNELNYNVTEKEVLALLRIFDIYYNLLVGREIQVLTRYSTLAWLFKSTGLQGRLGQWSALLAPWTLEITKCTKGEDEILGAIAASITPRAKIDDAQTKIAPRKEPKRRIPAPIPTRDVWSLPGWEVVKVRSGNLENLTVNEAEYNGLILGLDMLEGLDRRRLVICGDSNLVIRQVRGEIDCKAPGLTLLKRKALDRLRKWNDHELVHVKRDWNGSAVSLASAALQRQGGVEVQRTLGHQDLVTLNRLDEISISKTENPVGLIREIRVDRIKQAQEEEVWIAGMKKYLSGSIADLTQAEARSYGKITTDYEVDEQDLLFYCPRRRATYLFQIIAMDHIPSLPRSHKGNTELLIWVDLFTGYVIAKASSSRSTQTVAESSEECANRTAERMVQTATRALKMYVRDLDQKDWGEYAERLTFAINTAHDRIREDTPTIWCMGGIRDRHWGLHYRLKEAISDRAERHNEDAGSHQIEGGSRVWLYLDRVKEGYARKLAHLWHGPFRVAEKINEFSVKLEIAGTGYQIFPVVRVSKLKLDKDFSDRPRVELTVDEADRLDFD
ncbi:reverse transcriptase, partial [Phytophthora megakarya]